MGSRPGRSLPSKKENAEAAARWIDPGSIERGRPVSPHGMLFLLLLFNFFLAKRGVTFELLLGKN
jgi:hypothetical protein